MGTLHQSYLPITAFQNDWDIPLQFELKDWGKGVPNWVSVNPDNRALAMMVTANDVIDLDSINDTAKSWTGGLVAFGRDGIRSYRKKVVIEVDTSSWTDTRPEDKANHKFVLTLGNYGLKVSCFYVIHKEKLDYLVL